MNNKKLKIGDKVIILSGSNKNKIGILLKILKYKHRVLIKGINLVKKHVKPSNKDTKGKIIIKEASIHISNISILDPKINKPTRIGFKFIEGKKIRFCIKSNTILN